MMSGDLFISRVWFVQCSRCANDDLSDEETPEEAAAQFEREGWTVENFGQYCPSCNGA